MRLPIDRDALRRKEGKGMEDWQREAVAFAVNGGASDYRRFGARFAAQWFADTFGGNLMWIPGGYAVDIGLHGYHFNHGEPEQWVEHWKAAARNAEGGSDS